jgi:hypothetical protein
VRYESDDLLVHLELIEHGRGAVAGTVDCARNAGTAAHPDRGGSDLLTLTRSGSERQRSVRVVRDSLPAALRRVDAARSMPGHRT